MDRTSPVPPSRPAELRRFTRLLTDSVEGNVKAAKMVRSSALTKKEDCTRELPAGKNNGLPSGKHIENHHL